MEVSRLCLPFYTSYSFSAHGSVASPTTSETALPKDSIDSVMAKSRNFLRLCGGGVGMGRQAMGVALEYLPRIQDPTFRRDLTLAKLLNCFCRPEPNVFLGANNNYCKQ